MRQIDADELVEIIKKVQDHMKEVNDEPLPVDAREIFTLFIDVVEKQPTAYDPDAVAKQMKECMDKLANEMCRQLDRGRIYGTKRAITRLFELVAEGLVDIVKKGGLT